jgi:hypothetical protein
MFLVAARSLLSRRVCSVRGFSLSPGAMVAMAKRALQEADCVCFDFDSTMITEEGIEARKDPIQKPPIVF